MADSEAARDAFRTFADAEIRPLADQIDRDQTFPETLIGRLAAQGYLAPWLAPDLGGRAMDYVTYGYLTEAVGHACASARSLLTAHGMTTQALARWGSTAQKERIVPQLARGEKIVALAVSEPRVGSDVANPETEVRSEGGTLVLNGRKNWITFGMRADLFLVLARYDGRPTTVLVEADSPGLTRSPIRDLMGVRGAMLANLSFDGCVIDEAQIVGRPGFGFSMVINEALSLGRYSVAWGCVGLLRASLDAAVAYTATRCQFGTEIRNHQLVAQKITNMMTDLRCATLLCERAGQLRDRGDPEAVVETMIAKYRASTAATRAADDAVQLHGANGVSPDYPVARFARDARIMEIIEGSTQVLQTNIAGYAYRGRLAEPSGPPSGEPQRGDRD